MDALRFNTAIAKLIELNNHVTKLDATPARGRRAAGADARAAGAAHRRGAVAQARPRRRPLTYVDFPVADPALLVDDTVELPGAGQRQGARPDHRRRRRRCRRRSRRPRSPTTRSSPRWTVRRRRRSSSCRAGWSTSSPDRGPGPKTLVRRGGRRDTVNQKTNPRGAHRGRRPTRRSSTVKRGSWSETVSESNGTHLVDLSSPPVHERGQTRMSSSAPSKSVTFRGRAVWPISPIRHPLPAKRRARRRSRCRSARAAGAVRARLVDAVGHPHRGELGRRWPSSANRSNPSSSRPSCSERAALGVARPRCVEALVEHCAEAGVQRVDHRDRRRVVVGTRHRPPTTYCAIILRSRYHDCGFATKRSTRAVRHRDRREAGRHAEALLRAAVRDVDAPRVDLDGDAAERGHAVDEQQRVALAAAPSGSTSLRTPGRRLGVDDRDHLRAADARSSSACGIDRLAPRRLDPHDLGAAPGRDVAHAFAEHAVHADHDDVARLDDVDERGLHAGRPGAADRRA